MKQRNFKTFSKIDQVRTVEENYMGYIAETGEYFISELEDPKANKQECVEWAQANGGKVLKQVRTITYYEEYADGLWLRARV